METELTRLSQLLNDTLSSDGDVVHEATKSLDLFSRVPHFPHLLLSIASGGESTGQKVAAATYLKKLARQYLHDGNSSGASKELKRQLMQTLLHAEPAVLKVLVEVFRSIVVAEFVENSLWPELVPELWSVMQNTDLINPGALCEWRTVNVLMVLQALIRPFQYFLNPKVAKEPVPEQLELVAKEILLPVLTAFTHLVEKELRGGELELEKEQIILLICKCTYFAVRSYMPSSLVPALPSLCHCLIALLGSLSLKGGDASNSGYLLRIKSGKRSLLIFCTLITRHRKYTDKLMQDIINCSLRIVSCSSNISELDFLSERIISVAFDVIAHVLETGPGWRLVSPHFQFLLDSAIFPTLVLNEKDISEWEEDPDEYIRKNLPSELEEISGLREDLFTARKSAINLLGVIATSKGPPMAASSNGSSASSKRKKGEKNKTNQRHSSMGELLVLPFLSKFPIPSDSNVSAAKISNDYFGVLMAFSGLQYFLEEQRPEYVAMLIRNRVLPLYKLSICPPYLLASSNWILGELASCLQEELSMEVYSSLLKALVIPDTADISNYPVRFSAAGAVMQLLENDYPPPEWLPLLQVVISRINVEDEETSILFQLLTSMVETSIVNLVDHIPLMVSSLVRALIGFIHPGSEEWPQVVQRGFATLAATAQSWDNFLSEEIGKNESSDRWASARTAVGKALSELLQHAWLKPILSMVKEEVSPTQMCLDHSSVLLQTILLSVTGTDALEELKISELLVVWASLISDWHAWEESEDLSVFDCIKEVVSLHKEYGLKDFIVRRSPPPPGPPVPDQSIIEGITAFVSEAISQYVSATCRACACVHMLLHATNCETDCVKQSLVSAFSCAAFSRFRETQQQPCSLWTSLLLVISSCYLCSPDIVERILERDLEGGFTVWVSALTFVSTSRSDPSLQLKSEIKLAVLTLAMVIERLSAHKNPSEKLLRDCFRSLMEISVRLKELHEEVDEDGENNSETEEDEEDDGDSDDAYDSEDSEGYEHVETEEEFLERYAKAAEALDAEVAIEEGDIKDEGHEIELGAFEEVEEQKVVYSLLGKHSRFLVQGQPLSLEPHVISNFLDVFPECKPFFQ